MSAVASWPRPAALVDPATRLLVVEASAGTGKTYFLEHRVIDLILSGARIDQVLVVTFTEKATAELKLRVRDLLIRMAAAPPGDPPDAEAWRLDGEARQRLRDAIASFDRAPISTIHGFCQRLLVEDAFAGRRLFDQTQIPDEVAFDEAFRVTLRAELAVDDRHRRLLSQWLATGRGVDKLRDMLLECARRAAPIRPPYQPARLAAALRAVQAALGACDGPGGIGVNVAGRLRGLHHATQRALPGWVETIAEGISSLPLDEDDGSLAAASLRVLGDEVGTIVDKTEGKITATSAEVAALLAALTDLRAAMVPLDAACAQSFLPAVLAHVETSKHRHGQFDFQDMLRLVAETLRGPRGGELAERLRRRHPWALIDEFQDTDELQWDIFRRVWMSEDAGDIDAANGAPPGLGLTVVGDPKQAIYGFRGADVYTYLDARDAMMAAGAARITLGDNRRSSQELVAAVNHLLTGAAGEPFFTGDIDYPEPVRAAATLTVRDGTGRAPPPVTVLEVVVGNGDKLTSERFRSAVIERIATEIEALLRDPARVLTLIGSDGRRHKVGPGDVFILTRSNAESDEVATALRRRALPCAVYQREHLFDGREAEEVADLLEAIAAPRDRSTRLRAWTTAFFDIPLAELCDLADLPDEHPLVSVLFEWRTLAGRMEYERLFARILEDTRVTERALVIGHGERVIGNLQHVFELLLEEVARSRCEVHELAARLRRWIDDGKLDRPDESDVQRVETDAAAIQIMTIHRAKGLEAAVVFLVGGTGGTPPRKTYLYHDRDRRRLLHVGTATGEAKERIDAEEDHENERLCYVALTRAKVRLYLPWSASLEPRKGAAYRPVHRTLTALAGARDHGDAARWFAFERVTAGAAERPEAPALRVVGDPLDGFVAPPAPEPVPPPVLAHHQRGTAVTSYTRLKHGALGPLEIALDDFRGDAADSGPSPSPEELPAGATTGVFLHEVLERVDFASAAPVRDPAAWAAQPAVAGVFARAAQHHDIDPVHLPHAHRVIHGVLTQDVVLGGVRRRLCDAPPDRLAREVEFVYAVDDDRYVKGFIDLMVAWDDRVWVIDYKSDLLAGFGVDAARQHVAGHYDVQRRLYGLAAARMIGIDGADAMHRLGGLAFWFIRSGLVVEASPTWADLGSWQRWLAALEVW